MGCCTRCRGAGEDTLAWMFEVCALFSGNRYRKLARTGPQVVGLTTDRLLECEVWDEVNGRACLMQGLEAFEAARYACRSICGASLEAMMAVWSCCGAL